MQQQPKHKFLSSSFILKEVKAPVRMSRILDGLQPVGMIHL